jgi:hypothetical protein
MFTVIAVASCKSDQVTMPDPEPVSIRISPLSDVVEVGGQTRLTATVSGSNNRSVTWSSSNPAVATVDASTGVVAGITVGSATITAVAVADPAKRDSATVEVISATRDYAIVGAQFTQGIQDAAGAIPIVLSGGAAVVNVLVRAVPSSSVPMTVGLRLTDAAGDLVWSDTTATRGTLDSQPSYGKPSAQFLVPAAVLRPGLRWQVVRDPSKVLPDDSAANDVFPRGGPEALATVAVPMLNLRFVPIVLTSNDNATGNVSSANLSEYLRTVRSIHPLGAIDAYVGPPLAVSASFGTAPTGGDISFWLQLLSDLDFARIIDPVEPDANWYGIVRPPSGFNYTNFGGFSYIPTSGTDTGPGTRTSASVQVNWFSRPTQARDLVAHELGHAFGRRHAPCGGATGVDPAFPVAGGLLDMVGHDVYGWANGLASSAVTVPTTTGDVMGYCFPTWASTYTYSAVLQFRGAPATVASTPAAAAPRSLAAATRVLVVRGSIEDGKGVKLHPAFTLDARPILPERAGPYRLEGLAADGRVLFSYAFEPAVLDHAPGVRHFTVALPLAPELEAALETLVVQGPAGAARVASSRVIASDAVGRSAGGVLLARESDGSLSASCAAGDAGIAIQQTSNGRMLGSAPTSSMRVIAEPGTPVTVLCSDGVRSRHWSGTAP